MQIFDIRDLVRNWFENNCRVGWHAVEAVGAANARDEVGALSLEHFPDLLFGLLHMAMRLGIHHACDQQPGVQLIEVLHLSTPKMDRTIKAPDQTPEHSWDERLFRAGDGHLFFLPLPCAKQRDSATLMDPIFDIVFEDTRWQAFGLDGLAETAAAAVFAQLGLSPTGFLISLLGCDDQRIAALNTEFRGKPVPTNVLSWPSEERAAEEAGGIPDLPEPGDAEDPGELGDIAIAYETCMREATDQGKDPREHVTHLMVHGILHLLGYDHIDDADAAVMENLETRILAGLGIPDPY